jgi:hypothetical protein
LSLLFRGAGQDKSAAGGSLPDRGETLIIFGGGRLLAGPVQAGSSGGNGAVLGGF